MEFPLLIRCTPKGQRTRLLRGPLSIVANLQKEGLLLYNPSHRKGMRMNQGSEHGVSLVEVLLMLAIMALLAVWAVPSFHDLLARYRLKGAAETLFGELHRARLGAIQRNRTLSARFTIQPSGQWCLGLSDDVGEGCHCDQSDCLLEGHPAPRLDSTALPRVRLDTNLPRHTLLFSPLRGGARPGSVFLSTAKHEARIVISSLGRMRLCSDQLADYPPC